MDDFTLSRPYSSSDPARLGTRFRIFPQPSFVLGYEKPETVLVSTPPGSILAGPSDSRMYVIDPAGGKEPYSYPYLPPYGGHLGPPAEPGPDGHFDHLPTDSRAFVLAHAYACVRRLLDIAESYRGEEIPWFFEQGCPRLEIVPHLHWDNAHAGYGFLELGEDATLGEPVPFALNFDAIAHETSHLILLSLLGTPRASRVPEEFFAYHEAVADFFSLVGLLHFDTALDLILRRTRGNLLLVNELDRFAELAQERQVRTLNHALKIHDVGQDLHDRAKPFAGALFDSLIEIYQVLLVERGLSQLDPREIEEARLDLSDSDIEQEFAITQGEYEFRHFQVKSALAEARDIMGELLVTSWQSLDPDTVTFADAAEAMIALAESGRARRISDRLYGNFTWRGIL